MRWMQLIVIATIASICLAEQPEIVGCEHASPVVCFVDHAQAKVRSCLLSTIPLHAPGTNRTQTRPAHDDEQRNACVADAHREIDPLYREALLEVRYIRGTTRAVMDYYEDWEEVLSRPGTAPAASSAGSPSSSRADIERLNVKAQHLRQSR
jgi:hypothetical protein